MANFIVFISTGKIVRTGNCPEAYINLQAQTGETVIEGLATFEEDYIPDTSNPAPSPRPVNPSTLDKTTVTADGIDKIILSNTPTGSTITLGTLTDTSDGTDVELTFDITGTYTLKVELFPYLPFEATIDAT